MQKKFLKGFTLVELLIVIIIIAVLATVVLVTINPAKQRAKARLVTVKTNTGAACRAQAACMVEKDASGCASFAGIEIADPSTTGVGYGFGAVGASYAITGSASIDSVAFSFVCNNLGPNKGKVVCTAAGTGCADYGVE